MAGDQVVNEAGEDSSHACYALIRHFESGVGK